MSRVLVAGEVNFIKTEHNTSTFKEQTHLIMKAIPAQCDHDLEAPH